MFLCQRASVFFSPGGKNFDAAVFFYSDPNPKRADAVGKITPGKGSMGT